MDPFAEVYIEFIQNHLPALKSGDYTLAIENTLLAKGIGEKNSFQSTDAIDFSVKGERFSLKPSDIISVFPPSGVVGEFSNVLPHIVFDRSTLPWERLIAQPNDKTNEKEVEKVNQMPWMALLVLNEDELQPRDENTTQSDKENGIVMSLGEYRTSIGGESILPKEFGETDDENLKVIFLKKSVLQKNKFLAPGSALSLLTSVRKSFLRLNLPKAISGSLYYEIIDAKGKLLEAEYLNLNDQSQLKIKGSKLKPGTYTLRYSLDKGAFTSVPLPTITPNDDFGHEPALIVANRLPKPGVKSIVHLVSLEERYVEKDNDYQFNFDAAPDKVPFVTLKSWAIHASKEKKSFKWFLENLQGIQGSNPNTLRLPSVKSSEAGESTTANQFLESGYIPMKHYFRRGGKSLSWYRGPLVPGHNEKLSIGSEVLPASCADELLLYDEAYGMLNVSYAAAWELGRLISLRNKSFSTSLYNWKRLHRMQIVQAEQQEVHPHLPYHNSIDPLVDLPDNIEKWLSKTGLLAGVPFNYLVPDEAMMPAESVRFFTVDQDWVACLIDGAFSVGRVTNEDAMKDQQLHKIHLAERTASLRISGFILRSEVVPGWPKLQVNGFDTTLSEEQKDQDIADPSKELKLLRMDHLSPSVLIALFEGDLKVVDIHEKPEMLHFGFDFDEKANQYHKRLLGADGKETQETLSLDDCLDTNTRIVDLLKLKGDIDAKKEKIGYSKDDELTSAQMALALIEGVQKVRFIRNENS